MPADSDKQPWVEADLGKTCKISRAILYEGANHAVKSFEIKAFSNNTWKTIYQGKTIGEKLEIKLPTTQTDNVKIEFTGFSHTPEIAEMVIL